MSLRRTTPAGRPPRGRGPGPSCGLGRRLVLPWEPPRDDLRYAVGAHRDAVEDVGRLHRPLLVRDHDELRAVRVAAQKLGEAADVRVVERGLDLVQEVERARPREEEREQERDRAERLLAAGEEREPRHALAGRPQLDLDPGFRLVVVPFGLRQPQPSLAAGEQRLRHVCEVALDRLESLLEPPLDGLRQVVAQLLQLGQRRLEIGALRRQLVQALVLGLVLLLREGVDLPELLAAALVAVELLGELLARPLLRRLRAGGREATLRLVTLGVPPRELPADPPQPLGRGAPGAPEVD